MEQVQRACRLEEKTRTFLETKSSPCVTEWVKAFHAELMSLKTSNCVTGIPHYLIHDIWILIEFKSLLAEPCLHVTSDAFNRSRVRACTFYEIHNGYEPIDAAGDGGFTRNELNSNKFSVWKLHMVSLLKGKEGGWEQNREVLLYFFQITNSIEHDQFDLIQGKQHRPVSWKCTFTYFASTETDYEEVPRKQFSNARDTTLMTSFFFVESHEVQERQSVMRPLFFLPVHGLSDSYESLIDVLKDTPGFHCWMLRRKGKMISAVVLEARKKEKRGIADPWHLIVVVRKAVLLGSAIRRSQRRQSGRQFGRVYLHD